MVDAALFVWAGAALYDGGRSFAKQHYGQAAWSTLVAFALIGVGTYLRTRP